MANPPVKRTINREPHGFRFDALQFHSFSSVSPGAGVANATVQARITLPYAVKIPLVAASFTAIDELSGGHLFNIAVGEGAYDTAGAQASQTATLANVPNHDGTVTTTVNGTSVVYTEVGGDTTVTILAGHVVSAINANATVSALVTATNVAGVITLTAVKPGTAGNAITLVVSTTDTSTTYTAGGATLAGGTNASVPTQPPSDQSDVSGTPQALGASVASGFAAAANTLFAADVALTATAGIGAPANQPALAAPTVGSGGVLRFIPSVPDAIYAAGTKLTLRVVTPATVGSITNLQVALAMLPVLPVQQQPANNQYWVAGTDF